LFAGQEDAFTYQESDQGGSFIHLRIGPLAQRYAALKLRLVAEHGDDPLAYGKGKSDFVEAVCGVGWVD
jgi:hypothetical protein